MNFISYDAAYSMYPAATFDACIATVNGERLSDKELRAVTKYQSRGWTFSTNPNLRLHGPKITQLFHFDEARWVGDRHVWCLPLKKLTIPDRLFTPASIPMTIDPVLMNSWRWEKDCDRVEIEGHVVSKLLRYRYAFADRSLGSEVITFLGTQGRFEFREQKALGIAEEHAPGRDDWK
jgi:hypothetical protein